MCSYCSISWKKQQPPFYIVQAFQWTFNMSRCLISNYKNTKTFFGDQYQKRYIKMEISLNFYFVDQYTIYHIKFMWTSKACLFYRVKLKSTKIDYALAVTIIVHFKQCFYSSMLNSHSFLVKTSNYFNLYKYSPLNMRL